MTEIIINADDCGISKHVNECIKHFIDAGKLTSTTVMANMDDIEGAKSLYDTYCKDISFGIHLNLTQGTPLLYSQPMLDAGIVIEEDGVYKFCGRFPYKYVSSIIRRDAKKELEAQIEKILDFGFVPTHIDGHHFVHTYPSMLTVTPSLLKKYNIRKVRRMNNYHHSAMQTLLRNSWVKLIKLQNNNVKSTDYFAGIKQFFISNRICNGTIELMCHPGGYDSKEGEFMDNLIIPKEIKLISYHNI